MVIATTLAALCSHYGEIDALRRTLAGVACAAVGLLFAVVLKMMMSPLKRRDVTALVILAAIFVAIGGANSAIPEMQRAAADAHRWLIDKQFADVFAMSQLSPRPNVLIVMLIGYSVAGVAAALAAAVAMFGPTRCLPIM